MAADRNEHFLPLTDPDGAAAVFFIAAVPWTRTIEGEPAPVRRVEIAHTTSTLADYATLAQLDSHVGLGYCSLLIGQRVALIRGGVEIAAWPVDSTGWSWTGTRDEDAAWAFRANPERRPLRPGVGDGIIVAQGALADVREAALIQSAADPEATIIVAGQCFFDAHWH